MKSGEFSLQPALSYKESLEGIHRVELAEIETEYAREREILDLLNSLERQGCNDADQRLSSGKLDMGTIGVLFGEIEVVEIRIRQQMRLLEDLAEKTRQKREKLIEISKEKKVLEKLKEKHKSRAMRALTQAENKVMGDIATSQYHRRKLA